MTTENKLHRLTERDSRLAHYVALLGVWGYIWATSHFRCKIWRHILAR